MTVKVGCIVEGEGDVAAVPLLIRRIAAELYPELAIDTPRPIRVHRNQVVQPDKLEQARQADSFDKCYRDIVRLLEELQKAGIQ